ncbi:16S rRNA (cytidine(1402)-2'-O)-methyltransferase [Actinomycetospora endophytica]|uniref:Ribosomal RNA small subunit methyltransferase I n=1 Tax=Actinomycetospora endophytica TaxID=2291215 RepID=A0ABS8PJ25_9PSEU|nr:16S rRNA (cytidine(1402)-2'-O)-methyltransferase [Actinomycetospora endophytica]MCD2197396.1 16S rRNA (cytidine(1402)-2'-O)-methyltransferase [Actinomycetospora endophytica]
MGVLLLAATPLGDPGDASARLRDALATADVVAAEDTRRLARLTSALGVTVTGTVVSFYEDVERARIPRLLEELRGGATVLVVSDAGMPAVSDPGYRLVAACVEDGLTVRCLPGPSAVLAALAVSGLPTDRFCFEGFAPRADGKRRSWFAELATEQRTTVFFESPRRLASLLAVAVDVLGADRPAVVCRELTKTHEEVVRGGLGELAAWARERDVLGEVTVVLGGAVLVAPEPEELADEVLALVAGGQRLKDAARAVASERGVSTNALYDAAVRLRRM